MSYNLQCLDFGGSPCRFQLAALASCAMAWLKPFNVSTFLCICCTRSSVNVLIVFLCVLFLCVLFEHIMVVTTVPTKSMPALCQCFVLTAAVMLAALHKVLKVRLTQDTT